MNGIPSTASAESAASGTNVSPFVQLRNENLPAKKPKAVRAKKAAPVPANDAGDTPPGTPKAAKKKAAPKRKAAKAVKTKAETPPRTGTDG